MRGPVLLLVACLLASACLETTPPVPSPDPADPNGEITTVAAGEPDTIDPQKESFASEIAHTMMVFEPLLSFDPRTLQPIPAAARALPAVSEDGLTVTFALRDGQVYSDGAPVTASDFVYGWKRLCDPNVSGDFAFAGYVIAGCERWNEMDPKRASLDDLGAARNGVGVAAPDATHVVFTLARPAPYFLAVAALWIGVPVRASDLTTGGDHWTEPATFTGNGPFKLTEWKHNERLVFERNDRYRAPAKIKRWTKVIIPDQAVAAAAFRNRELDVAPADKGAEASVRRSAGLSMYLGFNVVRPPFDDAAVRMAFARSLDRDALVRDVIPSPAVPSLTFIAPGLPGANPSDTTQAFDPAAARALLAASRYATAIPVIRFTYQPSAERTPVVRWVIAQWRSNLGVDVLEDPILPWCCSQLIRTPQMRPQLLYLGWSVEYPDPQDWLSTVFRSTSTITRTSYSSAEFDALVDRADVERDAAKRLDLYMEAQRVLTRDAPVAFLYSTEVRYLVSHRLRGYALTASDWEFGQFTLAAMYVAKPGF
ncbi:MAG: peptide ABC transporter substrate-binding protein [Chloroflexota bacterium]|nr:peptide ABC transporter substrate-binding protein [Chloroflexota bacterium]